MFWRRGYLDLLLYQCEVRKGGIEEDFWVLASATVWTVVLFIGWGSLGGID